MKNKLMGIILGLFLVLMVTGSASAYGLNDWYFDFDGAGGNAATQINEYLDISSPNLVDTTMTSATTFDFKNYGFVVSRSYDDGPANPTNLTAVYTFSGSAELGGAINFDSGTLALYLDDFGSSYATASDSDSSFYGANDGTPIATFDLVSGSGAILTDGLPNGTFSINYEATNITAGYFFMPDGTTDLSTLDPITLTMGFTTTNASAVGNPTDGLVSELMDYAGLTDVPENDPPTDFWLASGGQFRINVVPEPTTMILFGVGLLGIAGITRKKVHS
jgi:hypothetical protein